MKKTTSYRLLSIDLDGTLLSPIIRKASKKDCVSIQRFMSANGTAVLNTGRPPYAVYPALKKINKLGRNNVKIISCLNGSYIKDQNDGTLFESKISHDYCKEFYQIVKQCKYKSLWIWFYMPRGIDNGCIESYPKPWWACFYPIGKVSKIKDFNDLSSYKIAVISTNSNTLSKIYQEFINHNLDKVTNITRSSAHLIEITNIGIDKGYAITKLQSKYGISKNCTCSLGDTFNDLSAFNQSGLSVAVKPKSSTLAGKVDYIIPKKRNGVSEAIYKHVLKDRVDTKEFKLVFSDLDGTLLDAKTKLYSKETNIALQQCTNHLIPIAIATGRGNIEAFNLSKMLNLNPKTNIYLVGCNGATIYDCYTNKFLFTAPIDKELVPKVYDEIVKLAHTLNDNLGFLMEQHEPEVLYWNRAFWNANNIKKTGNPEIYDPWLTTKPIYLTECPDVICYKILVKFPNHDAAVKGCKHLADRFPNLEVCLSSPVNVEINAHGISKGSAAKTLSKLTGISLDHFLVLGDGQNDMNVLSICKHSFAPCYAPQEVKQAAHNVVEDVDIQSFAAKVIYDNILKNKSK